MSKLLLAGLVGILLSVAPARAQSPSGYSTQTEIQQRAHAARMAEIRRHNYAQQEAIRLLFGPQGLPALTRPSDAWNAGRMRFRGNRAFPNQIYYR
jgi:hypothetical protein